MKDTAVCATGCKKSAGKRFNPTYGQESIPLPTKQLIYQYHRCDLTSGLGEGGERGTACVCMRDCVSL